jgi:hypothetical protein
MWNCAVGASRANAIVLVDRGAESYVKISGQRVAAQVSDTEQGVRRWSWGSNAVDVDAEGLARYYEGGDYEAPKGKFRCRRMD